MIDHLPPWKGNLMNPGGLLALIKSTLLALPIYTAINISLPPWFLRAAEKIVKALTG
jgi:hypothetical protein